MKNCERIPGDAYPAMHQFYYISDITLRINRGERNPGEKSEDTAAVSRHLAAGKAKPTEGRTARLVRRGRAVRGFFRKI
jgi:hypothetical protein